MTNSILEKSHRGLCEVIYFIDVTAGPCHWLESNPHVIALFIFYWIVGFLVYVFLYFLVRNANLVNLLQRLCFFWFSVGLNWRRLIQHKLCRTNNLFLNSLRLLKSLHGRDVSKVRTLKLMWRCICQRIALLNQAFGWRLFITIINNLYLALMYIIHQVFQIRFIFELNVKVCGVIWIQFVLH